MLGVLVRLEYVKQFSAKYWEGEKFEYYSCRNWIFYILGLALSSPGPGTSKTGLMISQIYMYAQPWFLMNWRSHTLNFFGPYGLS